MKCSKRSIHRDGKRFKIGKKLKTASSWGEVLSLYVKLDIRLINRECRGDRQWSKHEARREPMNFWDEVISKITRAGSFQEMSALCPFICLVQIQVTASKLEIASQSR
jgi:hypothetical protein